MNGKGDSPRNCSSKDFKKNYDLIEWSNKKGKVKCPECKQGVKKSYNTCPVCGYFLNKFLTC